MAHTFSELPPSVAKTLVSRQNKAIYPEPFVQFGPGKCFLPKFYDMYSDTIDNLEIREDDLWICSFIKAGI